MAYAAASAQSAVGNWSGKIDMSAVKAKDANQKAQIDMFRQIVSKSTIKLSMKNDKTYRFSMTATVGGKSQTTSEDGKWSQKGRSVTTVDPKGKKNTMTISADGKKMIMLPGADEDAPKGAKMVFTRS